jgi:hypothetical protein
MSKIHHFKGFSVVDGDMKIKLNMDRFSRQYQEAQYLLDGMVMDSMVPFMPMITGDFINRTRIESTSLQGTDLYVQRRHLMDVFCMRVKPWLTNQPEALMQDVEQKKYLLVSIPVRQRQKRILNTPNKRTHGHKPIGLMPQNDNTAVHGFAK